MTDFSLLNELMVGPNALLDAYRTNWFCGPDRYETYIRTDVQLTLQKRQRP